MNGQVKGGLCEWLGCFLRGPSGRESRARLVKGLGLPTAEVRDSPGTGVRERGLCEEEEEGGGQRREPAGWR